MSIHECIDAVAKTLRAGTQVNFVKLAIMNDSNCSEARAMTIIGWARQVNAARKPNQDVGSCL